MQSLVGGGGQHQVLGGVGEHVVLQPCTSQFIGGGHFEAVDGQAGHTRLNMLAIRTAGQERGAPGVVCHKHAGQAHQLGGGRGGLHDGQ